MMYDFIIAADNAKFGQPEIKLGMSFGAGGTQRLRRWARPKAMDMCLTACMMDADRGRTRGLVSRVVPWRLMDEALGAALVIADFSQITVMAAKGIGQPRI